MMYFVKRLCMMRKKMRKYSFSIILLLTMLLAAALLLPGCHQEHSFGAWTVEVEPTCTESGRSVRVCACGEEECVTTPPRGHSPADWVVQLEPNCTRAGIQNQSCSQCDIILQSEQLPALGHTPGDWLIATASTCVTVGTQYQVCATCEVTIDVSVLELAEHKEGKWFVDISPTATEEGLKHQVCSVCNETLKTEVMPPVPDYYIILDAGHGGKDRGASKNDVLEKDINLQVTYKLKELLELRGAYIILSRQDDTYLSLEERAEFANGHTADLFVSVHCNSYEEDDAVAGFEAYYYQNRTAKSVADHILAGLKEDGQFKTRNVKPEEFYVLVNTQMPAILLELGFITNAEELRNLCDEAYQYALAEVIADSIVAALS